MNNLSESLMHQNMLNPQIIKKKLHLDLRHAKTFAQLAEAMIIHRTSNLSRLSEHFIGFANHDSNYKRIQRFLTNATIDEELCACLLIDILGIPAEEQMILTLDRTYWMHGKTHYNFLYLSVYYRGYGIPLFFDMLTDIKGHSSVSMRKSLLEKFIRIFGKERIAYITADREFDGNEWLSYLKAADISYVQRLKENTICMTNARGEYCQAATLCRHVKANCVEHLGQRKIYKSQGFSTDITIVKSPKNKTVLLAHSPEIQDTSLAYKLRWSIECGFKAMKSGGFNLDATRLRDPKRIVHLYRIIAILTAIAHKLGIGINEMQPIKIKAHGRKAISFIHLALRAWVKIATLAIHQNNPSKLHLWQKMQSMLQKLLNWSELNTKHNVIAT